MPGSLTTPGHPSACTDALERVAFHPQNGVGTPELGDYRGSMAGLYVPLSTLHVTPHDAPRMTRGQPDLLGLCCEGLAPFTPCRFVPAHSEIPNT